MRRFWTATAIALSLAGVAAADEWDKKTNITVNETILIPGKQLPPGKYVMKLLNSATNRHIVQIFNEDQTQLQATVMAFNNEQLRPDPDGKTVLTFWETPAGSPPALRAWFYPGDTWGQEFAYPKEMAERLAALNRTRVASYETAAVKGTPTEESLKALDIPAATPAPAPSGNGNGASTAARSTPAPNVAAAPERSQEPTLLAQNTPPPSPAPAAQPDDSTLPQTASNLPLIIALGVSLSALGALMALRRV